MTGDAAIQVVHAFSIKPNESRYVSVRHAAASNGGNRTTFFCRSTAAMDGTGRKVQLDFLPHLRTKEADSNEASRRYMVLVRNTDDREMRFTIGQTIGQVTALDTPAICPSSAGYGFIPADQGSEM